MLMNCFAGYRGSFNWHVCPLLADASDNPVMAVSRYNDAYVHFGSTAGAVGVRPRCFTQAVTSETRTLCVALTLADTVVTDAGRVNVVPVGSSGISVGNTRIQPFVSVNIPQYSNVRFGPAWELRRDALGTDVMTDGFRVSSLQHRAATDNLYYNLYTSAGADFNVFYFVCVPPVYDYTVKAV